MADTLRRPDAWSRRERPPAECWGEGKASLTQRGPRADSTSVGAVEEIVDRLSRLALFSDLANPRLVGIAHAFEEELFAPGQRILRQGLSGSGLYVILDGDAAVVIDGQERARLGRGDFFGEVSVLLGEPPTADVVASTLLRCLVVPEPEVRTFLVSNPNVMYRVLQAEARRLSTTLQWRS
jgi:CRP-like cAMP-binding protein